MTNKELNLLTLLTKWTAPLAALTALFGGIAWLTSLHNIAQTNEREISFLKKDFDQFRTGIYLKISTLDERMARIEGKLDIVINDRKIRSR